MLIEEYDKSKHNPRAIRELLAMAVGNPTPEKLSQLLDEFYAADSHSIFVASNSGKVNGIIGIDYTGRPQGYITHIAVNPDTRMQGVGRRLINYTTETLGLTDLEVETDQAAVDFYRACGFEIKEIKSQWPSIRRFRCFKSAISARF
jgi:ribosomal protein S18 acetylase RimI-like enzyme